MAAFLWLFYLGSSLMQQSQPKQVSPEVWAALHDLWLNLPVLPLHNLLALNIEKSKPNAVHKKDWVNLCLQVTQFRQATNPRDLCYGLLGVMEDDMLPLKVNYHAPVEEVLIEAAKVLVKGGDGTLTYLLSYAGIATPRRGEMGSLPS